MTTAKENALPFITDGDFLLLLKGTDWTYTYSDDRRVYDAGARQVSQMRALAHAMGRSEEADVYASMCLRPASEVDTKGIDFNSYPELGFVIVRKTWGNTPENYSILLASTDQRIRFCLAHIIAKVDTSNQLHNELVPYIVDAELNVKNPFSDAVRAKYPELAERWDSVKDDIFKFTSTEQVYTFLHSLFGV